MLAGAKQVAFVGVSDLDAAERFYGGVLGLPLDDKRPFALVHDTGATQLRITQVVEVRAAPYTVLGWVVADLEDEIDRIVAAGVSFHRYDGMEQDDRGIWTSPSGARIAWFPDPDGNNLSLQTRSCQDMDGYRSPARGGARTVSSRIQRSGPQRGVISR